MVAKGEFTVTVSKKEVVAAVLPLQEHWLPLSNLDLLLPPVDVGVFFCYKKPAYSGEHSMSFSSMVDVLKRSMAEALVSYYALAGEVVSNYIGEPELLCNNRGVDFVEAYANVELKDLNLYNPDESIEGKLVPMKKNGVLSVQVSYAYILVAVILTYNTRHNLLVNFLLSKEALRNLKTVHMPA